MKKASLEDKGVFNPKEAAAFFGIGEVRLRRFLKDNPKARFTVYYNGRCLIIRERFEEYLREHPEFIRRKRRDNDGK